MSTLPSAPLDFPWVIVGYGRVGQALALLAKEIGATVIATWNRSQDAADAAAVPAANRRFGALPESLEGVLKSPALIWLTVVDDALESVFEELADSFAAGSFVIHTSGSHSSDILAGGGQISKASLHPLQAVTDPAAAAERFHRTFWTVEGDDAAIDLLEVLLAPACIKPLRIDPDDKVLYHASAVCAANLLISLFDAAISIAEIANIDPATARKMLVELGRSSLDNLSTQNPDQALSGPAARGDLATIERHRQALKTRACHDPQLLEIYDILTRRALDHLT